MGKKKLKISSLTQLTVDETTKKVSNNESEGREFKLKFERNNLAKFAKTIAAFANRDGGALFFGIKDRPREVVGLNDNEISRRFGERPSRRTEVLVDVIILL